MHTRVSEIQSRALFESVINFGNLARSVTRPERRRKLDGSPVSAVDKLLDWHLVETVRRTLPHFGILAEESSAKVPLDGPYASIDAQDGSGYYLAGEPEWSVSLGLLGSEGPVSGFVSQPELGRAFAVRRGAGVLEGPCDLGFTPAKFMRLDRPKNVIGTDFGGLSPGRYYDEVERVLGSYRCSMKNMPAVHAGIEVARGAIRSWWSYTAHHWDLAVTALMLGELGGVAECLDGSPIPWDVVNMPPILLAHSREEAERTRAVLKA